MICRLLLFTAPPVCLCLTAGWLSLLHGGTRVSCVNSWVAVTAPWWDQGVLCQQLGGCHCSMVGPGCPVSTVGWLSLLHGGTRVSCVNSWVAVTAPWWDQGVLCQQIGASQSCYAKESYI